jgi:serralysin
VLNRAPDTAGYDYWLDEMARGMTRELVLIGFSESAENRAALLPGIQGGIGYLL